MKGVRLLIVLWVRIDGARCCVLGALGIRGCKFVTLRADSGWAVLL